MGRRRGRHRIALLVVPAIVACALPAVASAHAYLVGSDPPAGARLLGLARQRAPEHLELALVGDRLRGEHLHRRRLAGAVGAEQADARPLGDVEVEAGDGGDAPVALDDAAQADGQTLGHGL